MRVIDFIALILVIVGALNWGLIGFFQFNFVGMIFGGDASGWARLVFALVGLAGLWGLRWFAHCKKCTPKQG